MEGGEGGGLAWNLHLIGRGMGGERKGGGGERSLHGGREGGTISVAGHGGSQGGCDLRMGRLLVGRDLQTSQEGKGLGLGFQCRGLGFCELRIGRKVRVSVI
jgi:hypothetical protein